MGLNLGEVLASIGTPRVPVRIGAEIAKGKQAGDVFLPDRLVPKLEEIWQ